MWFVAILLAPLVEPLPEHGPRDIDLLDVDSPAGDAPSPGVPQAALGAELFRIAVSAHKLQRIAGHAACNLVGVAFRYRRVERAWHRPLRVAGSPVDQQAG